jgi:hypothetical protein
MSDTSTSRIVGEEAVPLRAAVPQPEKEPPTIVIEEEPVPVRQSAQRVEDEEREARLRVLTGRSRWR